MLFSGATALIPVFAQDILHVGAGCGRDAAQRPGFGATGDRVAADAVSPAASRRPAAVHGGRAVRGRRDRVRPVARLSGFRSRRCWSWAPADMVSVYIRGTLVPLATPDELRGRVTAVELVFIGASNELGMFVAGAGGALLGAVAGGAGGRQHDPADHAVLGGAVSQSAPARPVRGPSRQGWPAGLTRCRAFKWARKWRPGPESNRRTRICSPLHGHSATGPEAAGSGGSRRGGRVWRAHV